jgi:hypothetical protein
MKAWQAWREAVKLFWQRPVLSLPVLVAAVIPFVLEGVAMGRIGTDGQKRSRAQVRCGKQLAIATVLFSAALGFGLTCVRQIVIPEGGLNGTVAGWELDAMHSLIVALPYVLLFIALTLLVDHEA